MKYTIELIKNKPVCKVETIDNRLYIIEEEELYELLKTIEEEERFIESRKNKNLFLKNKKNNQIILFKDYKKLNKPLNDLYTKYELKRIKDKKIKSIKSKATLGVLTSTIMLSILSEEFKINLVNENNLNSNIYYEDLTEEETLETITIDEPEEYTNKNLDYETYIIEPTKKIESIEIDTKGIYSKGINDKVDPYMDEINERATKWGISPETMYDIISQEYGGSGTNLTHVVMSSWEDYVITAYNFEDNVLETIVLTNTPQKYKNVDHVITKEDLKNVKTNISVGAIILQYSLAQFNYNMALGIQAYNNGIGGVNKIIEETTRNTGISREKIIESEVPIWLDYTYVINNGDKNYFKNVVKHIDEDQEKTKLNDIYSISYLDDKNNVETKEVQYKLR